MEPSPNDPSPDRGPEADTLVLDEPAAGLLIVTGLPVAAASTIWQVFWLLGLVLTVALRPRSDPPDDHGDGGGGGGGGGLPVGPRPPVSTGTE